MKTKMKAGLVVQKGWVLLSLFTWLKRYFKDHAGITLGVKHVKLGEATLQKKLQISDITNTIQCWSAQPGVQTGMLYADIRKGSLTQIF